MSPFRILLELRMIELAMTTGAIRSAMLQSNNHHQQTNDQFYTGRMSFLSPNSCVDSIERELSPFTSVEMSVGGLHPLRRRAATDKLITQA